MSKNATTVTCAITGKEMLLEDALRLIVGGDKRVYVDYTREFAGDAVCVALESEALNALNAVRLSEAFGFEVQLKEDFLLVVQQKMRQMVLQKLALANKAGQLVWGHEKVRSALFEGKVALVFQAKEGSARECEKLLQGVQVSVSVIKCFRAEELAGILGRDHIGYVALARQGKLAKRMVSECKQLEVLNALQ